jgi:RNA polymerase sigma-70 factor (ECF subfamily)
MSRSLRRPVIESEGRGRASHSSDEEEVALVQAARAGDRKSFERLFSRYAPGLRGHMLAAAGRPDEADDLLQETGVRALAAVGSYDGRSAFSTWLFAIARHVSIDFIRRRMAQRELCARGGSEPDAIADDSEPSPLSKILATERAAALRGALERLPERHRTALIMRCVEGRSCGEIARALGTTPNAASILIYRAKSELREILEDLLEEGKGGRSA